MQRTNGWRPLVVERVEGLLADERKAQRTLYCYAAFSNIAVICGLVVPILAGSTVLASYQKDHGGNWPLLSGILTLAASVLVAVHRGLNCEGYHVKCRGALAELRSLAMSYERLLNTVAPEIAEQTFETLEARLVDFYKQFVEVLPLRPTQLLVETPAPA